MYILLGSYHHEFLARTESTVFERERFLQHILVKKSFFIFLTFFLNIFAYIFLSRTDNMAPFYMDARILLNE